MQDGKERSWESQSDCCTERKGSSLQITSESLAGFSLRGAHALGHDSMEYKFLWGDRKELINFIAFVFKWSAVFLCLSVGVPL